MYPHLRIVRPVTDLARAMEMYTRGLGLSRLGNFRDHEGFDGEMMGSVGAGFHFELVVSRHHPVQPSPTNEDLIVLYLPDTIEWTRRCQEMIDAGFKEVESFNPYWAERGRTFQDSDGYRVVIECAEWRGSMSEGG